MKALVNLLLMLFVSLLLTLSVLGGAGAGFYAAGSEDQTERLQREADEQWLKQVEDEIYEEFDNYEDPRTKSFKTRFEESEGFGQLPYFPSGAYFRRRPEESARLWPDRTDTLPNTGRSSISIIGEPPRVRDNISDTEVQWAKFGKDAWTSLFEKDNLTVDCGNDAINSFQIRSDKFSLAREVSKEKKDAVTGTSALYKKQFRSYHDNYKQRFKCLTGSPGWTWTREPDTEITEEEFNDPELSPLKKVQKDGKFFRINRMCSDEPNCRKQIGGSFNSNISYDVTDERMATQPDKNFNKIMDCDFSTVGVGLGFEGTKEIEITKQQFDRLPPPMKTERDGKYFQISSEAAGKNYPLSKITPIWDGALKGKFIPVQGGQTNDYSPEPRNMNFSYKCLKRPVFGPCKPVKYTRWTPFLASTGQGIRELRHSLGPLGTFDKTSREKIDPSEKLKNFLPYKGEQKIDPIEGLGKVRCHPTEVLTRVDFEVSEGMDAPKDWIRFAYTCCKM